MNVLDEFYYSQPGAVRETLLAMKEIILSLDAAITEHWKYNMPFFYYRGKMFCYLRINRKSGKPYLGVVDGKYIDHPLLIQEDRKRMKILYLDPEQDLPQEAILCVLQQGVTIRNKR